MASVASDRFSRWVRSSYKAAYVLGCRSLIARQKAGRWSRRNAHELGGPGLSGAADAVQPRRRSLAGEQSNVAWCEAAVTLKCLPHEKKTARER